MRAAPALVELARARLPTLHGELEVVAFERGDGRTIEDIAVIRGDVSGGEAKKILDGTAGRG